MRCFIQRAFSAYYAAGRQESGGMIDQPSTGLSGIEQYDGRQYVVLCNGNGVLAVYRIKTDGILKRLKRWPASIEGVRHDGQ